MQKQGGVWTRPTGVRGHFVQQKDAFLYSLIAGFVARLPRQDVSAIDLLFRISLPGITTGCMACLCLNGRGSDKGEGESSVVVHVSLKSCVGRSAPSRNCCYCGKKKRKKAEQRTPHVMEALHHCWGS